MNPKSIPAYPVSSDNYANPDSTGMALRDHFAGLAMHQFLAGAVLPQGFDASAQLAMLSARAYECADAMLAAR